MVSSLVSNGESSTRLSAASDMITPPTSSSTADRDVDEALFDAPCYTATMISRGIRDYMAREWRTARAAKDAYWAERIARYGPLEGLRIADELRRQALLHNPGWPDAASRKQDLLAHVRLAELFTRAASTRRS